MTTFKITIDVQFKSDDRADAFRQLATYLNKVADNPPGNWEDGDDLIILSRGHIRIVQIRAA